MVEEEIRLSKDFRLIIHGSSPEVLREVERVYNLQNKR